MRLAPLALLPKSVLGIAKELTRHLLKRPVCGLAVVGSRSDGEMVLIRRADTGTWALPGGTVEWGETLRRTLTREMAEEAGVDDVTFERVVGVFGEPDRDPRFHAVTVVVAARVGPIVRPPMNPLEIREARFFAPDALPPDMAMGMADFVAAARRGEPTVLE
ncbi:MAG: NUDIX hydrolase [Myxococcales bacterium]|nr:NUDIX hydrolase [Myxococcales bacterium]